MKLRTSKRGGILRKTFFLREEKTPSICVGKFIDCGGK